MCQNSLGCSNYEMVESRTLRGRKKSRNHDCTTVFRRATFDLVMDLLGRIPQDTTQVTYGVQESWFKDDLLQNQERSIAINRKSGKGSRGPREVVKSSSLDVFKTKWIQP